jgi:hypothetical protein
MRSAVWRAERGARNSILPRRGGLARRLLRSQPVIATMFALAVTGCAPHYWEGDDMYGAAEASPKPRPRAAAKAAAKIPLPSRALLAPQAEPKCEDMKAATGSLKTASVESKRMADSAGATNEPTKAIQPQDAGTTAAAAPPPVTGDAEAGLSLRIKLEYERECYRQAELRARGRLNQLQESVGATIKAVETQSR